MRILTLVHEYPPVGGGGGKVAQDICRGLTRRGHALTVLTAHWGELPVQEDDQGVQVLRLKSGRQQAFKASLTAMLGYVLAAVWRGSPIIRQLKPDVIHVHFAVPAGAAALALSRLTRTPYVLTAHLGDVPGGVPEKTGRWFSWLFPFTPPIWKDAAAVAAVSEYTRQLAEAAYPVRVQVIPNGVDLAALDPGQIQVNRPPRLVFAGRFVPQKNPLQVVRTLAQVKDLPWECIMLGDGPLMVDVRREAAAHNLQERILLPGWVTPEEVITQFRRSDILFMPSLSEGMPVVGVQALALGLALLVTRVGGWLGLVQPGENGLLFSFDQPEEAAGYLRSLLLDSQKLLAARLASRIHAARFDLDQIVAAYEQILSASR